MTTYYMWTLILVMIASGSFGGLINYFLTVKTNPEEASITKSITVGIGASFLVPLFLNMISSNLIDSIKGINGSPGDQSKVLVFAGFCLVASISSTAFIRTLSDHVLSEVKAARREAGEARLEAAEAKEDVQEVQATIEPIIDKETEPEPVEYRITRLGSMNGLSDNERTILGAFAQSEYTHRSVRGLSDETHIDGDEVQRILEGLATRRLVGTLERKNGPRWFITATGLDSVSG